MAKIQEEVNYGSSKVTFGTGDVAVWETEANPSLQGQLYSDGTQKNTIVSLLTQTISNNAYKQQVMGRYNKWWCQQ